VLLLFPATVAAIGFGRAATTDMLFSASLAVAMRAATRIVKLARWQPTDDVTVYAGAKPPPHDQALSEMLWRAGFGAALGLAALAKGPAALILAGGSAGLWTLATRRWRDGFALASPAAILVFALVALPWYVLCALRNPEFVDVFLIAHNFQRFFTPVFQHEQPFWFFGPILLLGLLPWTPLLIGVGRDGFMLLRSHRWVNSPSFFVACWVIFPVLFFSASKSKLPGYVLPAIPPLALLLARSMSKGVEQRDPLTRWLLAAAGMVLLVLGGLAAAPSLAAARMPGVAPEALRPLAFVLLAGAACTWILAATQRCQPAMAAVALSIASAAALLVRVNLPQMDSQISARATAQIVIADANQDERTVSVHQLHRAWHYGLNYYLHQEVSGWSVKNDTDYIVTSEVGLADLREQGAILGAMQVLVAPKAIVVIRDKAMRRNGPL
jgi:4-amino-4-deoxy-L-arabinose transferase-like glycosyltransferase